MIDQLGGDQPRAEMKQFDQDHDPTRVAAGYKAYFLFSLSSALILFIRGCANSAVDQNSAMNNPNVTSQGKQHAQKELNRMSGPSE